MWAKTPDRTCAGCLHPESMHTRSDGCTRRQSHHPGLVDSDVTCSCAAFVETVVGVPEPSGVPLGDPHRVCTCGHPRMLHSGVISCRCLREECACVSFADAIGSDGAPATPETNVSAPAALDARVATRATPQRERLPDERASYTKEFRLTYNHKDGSTDLMEFKVTASVYDDGRVGEIFIKADKTGTLVSGSLDAVAMLASMMLQHGVPLATVVGKLKGMRFPPAGFTKDADVPNCSSALDFIARWLEHRFMTKEAP